MGVRKKIARPQVLGHRGASAHYPENTMVAFLGAMSAGADGVELDVRLCATGELVVFHDDEVDRLCEGRGAVATKSWTELSDLKVAGEPIPLLSEVLEQLPKARINVELKKHPLGLALPLVRATIAAIEAAGAQDRVILSSFDPRLLALLRVLAPGLPRGLLFYEGQAFAMRRAWLAKALAVQARHPSQKLVTGHTMQKWTSAGYQVNTWTVDSPTKIRHLARLGVTTIITNDPKQALKALEASSDDATG